MRIIIKDSVLNLKVKTNNIKLAELILAFLRQESGNKVTDASTAFRIGMLTRDIMSKINEKPEEKPVVKPTVVKNETVVKPEPKLLVRVKRAYRHKGKFVRWTDAEINFIKNNLDMKTKNLAKCPELERHSFSAILTKRTAVKYGYTQQLSKQHIKMLGK